MVVYRHLYDMVLTGYFQPGEWIRERHIKELLGVSSTPIREALKMLVQERILELVPHHGVRIKTLSRKEIEDVYELRAELEGLAAQLAAKRGSLQQFRKMDEVLCQMEKNMEENAHLHDSQSLRSNNDFHDLIVEASGNQALKNTLAQLRAGINFIQLMSWKSNKNRPFMTSHQHRLILDAIMARDEQLARRRTEEHIWDSVTLVLQAVQEEDER